MRCTLITYIIMVFLSHTAGADNFSSQIDALINKQLPHATISILVKEIKTGQAIYSKNADKLLYPASNMKLFTAAAALYYWKPSHYFSTDLLKKNKAYYLRFGGSPSLTVDNLTQLILHLKNENKGLIQGNIIIDTSRFKPAYYPNGTSYDDLGWYYAAPDTAVILGKNAASYDLISATQLGKPVTIKPKKDGQQLTLINEVITVSPIDAKKHCSLNIEIKARNTLRLYGCVPQTKNPKTIHLALPDPAFFAKQTIKSTLEKNEVKHQGKIIDGVTPADASILASLNSDPLSKLINHMLKESDNLYADNLSRQLAYALTKEATNKQAIYALKEILSHHTQVDMSQIELADGVGTRYNMATTEQLVTLLTNIYNDKQVFPTLFKALPQAGVSGSLRDRMKKSILEKKVFAKTGTMHDISSLSGYIISPHGKSLVFSIIINGVNQPISKAKSLEEQILVRIEEHVNGDSPPSSSFA